jgi:hypothetical protein
LVIRIAIEAKDSLGCFEIPVPFKDTMVLVAVNRSVRSSRAARAKSISCREIEYKLRGARVGLPSGVKSNPSIAIGLALLVLTSFVLAGHATGVSVDEESLTTFEAAGILEATDVSFDIFDDDSFTIFFAGAAPSSDRRFAGAVVAWP